MRAIPLKGGKEWTPPVDFLQALNEVYYDVPAELERMRIWCLANPQRCKTARGVRRFVVNWLNKGGKLRPQIAPPVALAPQRGATDKHMSRQWIDKARALIRRS